MTYVDRAGLNSPVDMETDGPLMDDNMLRKAMEEEATPVTHLSHTHSHIYTHHTHTHTHVTQRHTDWIPLVLKVQHVIIVIDKQKEP